MHKNNDVKKKSHVSMALYNGVVKKRSLVSEIGKIMKQNSRPGAILRMINMNG